MAKIGLVDTFVLIPEGWHNFKIEDAKYEETFGKIEIKMISDKGLKYTEKFSLKSGNKLNEGALKAFSFFAKTATNDFTNREIDPTDLIGKYIRVEIVHTKLESTTKPGEYVTFANSKGKEPLDSFEVDLNQLLGMKG